MAAGLNVLLTQDKRGNRQDTLVFSFGNAGAHNGAVEFVGSVPYSGVAAKTVGNGWELISCEVGALVNGTHSDASLTATVEKTDGGTSMLATAPVVLNDSGTGPQNSSDGGTGDVSGVPSATEANRRLSDNQGFIVTLTETGSAGADPEDTYVNLVFARIQDFDPRA